MKVLLEKLKKIWPIVVGSYLYFVLLFPKIAIFPSVGGTPIRIEDLLLAPILLLTIVFFFQSRTKSRAVLPFHLFFLALIFIFFISTLLGAIGGALGRTDLAFMFVLRIAEYFSFFYLAYLTFRSIKAILTWAVGLVVLSIPISIYAIFQYFGIVGGWGGGQFAYQFMEEVPQGRVFSSFSGPYELGAFLIIVLLIILAMFPYVKSFYFKSALFLIYLLNVIGLSYTGSRVPLLALAVGGVAILIFLKHKKQTLFLMLLAVIIPFSTSKVLTERYDFLMANIDLAWSRLADIKMDFPVPSDLASGFSKTSVDEKKLYLVSSTQSKSNSPSSSTPISAELSLTTPTTTTSSTPSLATASPESALPAVKVLPKVEDAYSDLPNLLKEGGFEAKGDWSLFGEAKVTEDSTKAFEGSRFVLIKPNEDPSGIAWEIKNLNPYKKYRLSLKVYRESPSATFRFVTNNEVDWYPIIALQGYRGRIPLLGAGQIFLSISKSSPAEKWVIAAVEFDSVTDLKSFSPNNRILEGLFRVDDIRLQEVGTIQTLAELTATNSLKLFGLPILDKSLAGRVSVQWPLVIDVFKKSPLIGGGMSVMGTGVDGEFMTILAETGLIGFGAFISFLFFLSVWGLKRVKANPPTTVRTFYVTFLAIVAAVVIEGTFVDVFRASKIASLFWFLTGLAVAFSFLLPKFSTDVPQEFVSELEDRVSLFFRNKKQAIFRFHFLEFIFSYLLLFYLIFTVLFPKIPIFEDPSLATPIRIDDLVTAFVLFLTVTLGMILKKKLLPPKDRLIVLAGLVIAVMFISTAYGLLMGLMKEYTVPMSFILRQMEYLTPLYVGVVTLHSQRQIKATLIGFTLLVIPVAIHTFLQLFGIWGGYGGGFYNYQYVRVDDRVFASFSGPYEIGAYFVIALSLIGALVVGLKKYQKIAAILLLILAICSFSFINARIPVIALFVAMLSLIPTMRRYLIPIALALTIVVAPIIISPIAQYRVNQFLGEINLRYLKNLPYFQEEWFQKALNDNINATLDRVDKFYQARSVGIQIPGLNPAKPAEETVPPVSSNSPQVSDPLTNEPEKSVATSASTTVAQETVSSSASSTPTAPAAISEPAQTQSAPPAPSPTKQLYERFAIHDASLSWRLETHWPRALEAWQQSLIIGSGMSVAGIGVDNEYLTLLAETGVLGLGIFLFFLGFLVYRGYFLVRRAESGLERALFAGVTIGIVGLIVEGVLVDVFRASKIAYIFWSLVAIAVVATSLMKRSSHNSSPELTKATQDHPA